MIIPIGDDDSRRRTFPVVNLVLIGVNILAYLYVYYLVDPVTRQNILNNYVVIPQEIVQGQDLPPAGPSPLWITLFTAMFLHANFLHIAGNMLFLFIFGDNVEDAFGHIGYLVFYLFCGAVASLTQVFVVEAYQGAAGIATGELGASGAIAGVLRAYLVMFPHARVRTIIGFGLFFFTRLSAGLVIGVWFLLQFIPGLANIRELGGVAYFAHVGGFVVGALLALLFRPRRFQGASLPPGTPPGPAPGYYQQ